jgi:hypothetical protein
VVYKSDAKNLHLANKEKQFKSSNRKFCRTKENLSFCQQPNNVTAKRINKPFFIISWFLKTLPGFRSTSTHRKNATD